MNKSLLLFATALGLSAAASSPARAELRKFNLFTVEVQGVKMWIPSTMVVNKGDDVEINATVKIPGTDVQHGFAIPDFKIVEVANENGKMIKFKADKAGIFPFMCHLHPAHVGGQLVVLKK